MTSPHNEPPIEETGSVETSAPLSSEGNLIAAPDTHPGAQELQSNDVVGSRIQAAQTGEPRGGNATIEARSTPQLLTGRAVRVLEDVPSLSPTRLTWRELKKNRLAIVGLWTLIFLYTVALFAPFLAPYDATDANPGGRSLTFHAPMKMRWHTADGNFQVRPFVYQTQRSYTPEREILDLPVASQPRSIQWFVRGSEYRLFGLFKTDLHLFGVQNGYVYLLGTDQQGRDYFSRLLVGSQISLSVGLIAIAITFALGMIVGGISGFYGGVTDNIIMRACEILMSVPDFYLLLALAAALPVDMDPVKVYLLIIIILSFIGWAGMARVVRGMVLSVREREYVEAARALGVSDFRIIVRHILPSTFTYAIVAATMSVPGYILAEAGLSFLGLGIREPMASWGNMLSAAQNLNTLEDQRWILAPAAAIFITTLAFNFLGDGLRDALDPKSRKLG